MPAPDKKKDIRNNLPEFIEQITDLFGPLIKESGMEMDDLKGELPEDKKRFIPFMDDEDKEHIRKEISSIVDEWNLPEQKKKETEPLWDDPYTGARFASFHLTNIIWAEPGEGKPSCTPPNELYIPRVALLHDYEMICVTETPNEISPRIPLYLAGTYGRDVLKYDLE